MIFIAILQLFKGAFQFKFYHQFISLALNQQLNQYRNVIQLENLNSLSVNREKCFGKAAGIL